MSKRFSERILDFLKKPDYRPMQAKRLAIALGIADAQYGDFHDTVDAMRRVGRVVLGTGNALMLPQPRGEIAGTFRANPRGFGFVVPDGPTVHGDLYIAPGASLDAVTGDTVQCRVLRRGQRDGKPAFGGRIIRVIKRGNSRFVGLLSREGGIWFVQPDGNTLHVPILIGDAEAKGAKAGDQVVVEIVRYPSEGKPAKGVIVERLGKRGKPGVDLLSIIRQYQLPEAFSDEVLEDARAAIADFDPESALGSREDLSHLTIITIDPDDAKDYDDAISLERVGQDAATGRRARKGKGKAGGKGAGKQAVWELGVHIADVSAFVREGTALNAEADERATSVYLPGMVIPMLPEVLSNGVCSLQEGEWRFTKSAFIQYSATGEVIGARFANTMIRSAKRLTYGQATAILEGKLGKLGKDVIDLVQRMNTLARAIRKRRLDEGMVVLELPEVELVFDDQGRVIDAEPADTSFSHTIIEMFMVEANEAVARLLQGVRVPFLRRIHPEPDEAALEGLARLLRAAGHALPAKLSAADLQRILEPVRGKPEAYAVSLAVLKSMQMAEYSPEAIGHFALASKAYAHFTSPIRRYPDLMVHRLLDLHLRGQLRRRKRGDIDGVPDEESLVEIGRRMSFASRRAEAAESELKTLKVLQLLEGRIGEEFEGVVTGVTNFGLFVQHPRFLIDGLLRVEDLPDDWWEVDVRAGRVKGERSHRTIAMGSRIKVVISQVDVSARQLGLAVAEDKQVGRQAKGKPKGAKRGTPNKTSQGKSGRGRGGATASKGKTAHRKGRSRRR